MRDQFNTIIYKTQAHLSRLWRQYPRDITFSVPIPQELVCNTTFPEPYAEVRLTDCGDMFKIKAKVDGQFKTIFSTRKGDQVSEKTLLVPDYILEHVAYQLAFAIMQQFDSISNEGPIIGRYPIWTHKEYHFGLEVKSTNFPSWMGEFPRKNAPWTMEEESLLMTEYRQQIGIPEMMKIHGRDMGGIESRLCKLFPEYAAVMKGTPAKVIELEQVTEKMGALGRELNRLKAEVFDMRKRRY